MDALLKVMGGSLGIVVPALFVLAIGKGIDRTWEEARRRSAARRMLTGLVVMWTIVVWSVSLGGLLSYHAGDTIPRVFIALGLPVLAGVMALASKTFRAILDHTPLATLVGVQSFRFAGAAFLLIVQLGILPSAFASGGYGDLATASLAAGTAFLLARRATATAGALAMFWAFTVAGVLDLLNVAYLMLKFYPIWYAGLPSSAPTADFALVMIPAIAAPVALLLHVYAIRAVVRGPVPMGSHPAA